jgi:hypothetical protein
MRNVAASIELFAPSIPNRAIFFGPSPYLNHAQRPDESKIFGIINLCTTDVPNCIWKE